MGRLFPLAGLNDAKGAVKLVRFAAVDSGTLSLEAP